MTFRLVWPTFKNSPDPRTGPSEPLPEGGHVYSLHARPSDTVPFYVGAGGKLYDPSRRATPRRMVPGVHWLYLHRKGPMELAGSVLEDVARPANRRRFAIRVTLSDAVEQEVVVLGNPFWNEAARLTGRSAWPQAPASEGLDGQIRWVYMSTYQPGYTPDLVLRGRELGFGVVIQHDPRDYPATTDRWGNAIRATTGQTADQIRGWLLAALQAAPRSLSLADATAAVGTVQLVATRIGGRRTDGHGDPWGEDNKWTTRGTDAGAGDDVQVVYPSNVADEAVWRAQRLTASRGYHALPEGDTFHGAVESRDLDEAARALATRLARGRRRTRVYIEGGNMLVGTQRSGWPYALVGHDSLVVSMIDMRRAGLLTEHDVELSWAHLRRAAPPPPLPPPIDPAAGLEADLARMGYFDGPPDRDGAGFTTPAAVTDAAERARRTWEVKAQLEATRVKMMVDVRVSPSNLAVIEQLDFHNDMHMRPLFPSTLLVNDPARALVLVRDVLARPGLGGLARATLQSMEAWLVAEATPALEALLVRAIAQCQAIGLHCVRCPGVFSTAAPHPGGFRRWANFMNAVPGSVAAAPAPISGHATPPAPALPVGTRYYMTNASSIVPLQDAFAAWLTALRIPGLADTVDRVYFLGGEEAYPAIATRPAISWSEVSLDSSGGLDCRESHHGGRRAAIDDVAIDPDRTPTAIV